ncbi:hypothetical protein [Nocardioides solisilvae]|uniref:hypothetical protein n=1 Tax=Nocardioides solisilvae TaxID=1542435 RepID=UPI000D740A53|nr:hypothetical protein [Nocardioides solisilvae]
MVTIARLLSWQPGRLDGVVTSLVGQRRELTDLQDEVWDSRPPYSWMGQAGESARDSHEKLRLRLLDLVAEVSKVAASVDFAQNEIEAARSALRQALDAAEAKGFKVDRQSGRITDPATYDTPADVTAAEGAMQVIADDISAALDKAATADADLARALDAAVAGEVEGGSGSLDDAVSQLPSALEHLTPREIAERYGQDVALETLQFFLEAEGELASWELEGAARATYRVMADGKVVMVLQLEGGLGREIEIGGAEVDASAGLTTDLELTFGSAEEARAFLDGLDDRALDLGWTDLPKAPYAVAKNVADYIQEQDVTSFKTGMYAKGELEFDAEWARGEGSGRVDGYYDWVKEEYGVKFAASVEAEVGRKGTDWSASAELAAEARIDRHGATQDVTLSGKVGAGYATEKLGIPVQNSTTGGGVDVEVKMSRDSRHFDEFDAAMRGGDLDRAAGLALDHGQVIVRTTGTVDIASGEHEVDLKIAEAEVRYGGSVETAQQVWVRPYDQDFVIRMDPKELR